MQGTVVKSTGSWYTVRTADNKRIDCKLKGRIRTQNLKSTNPVVVGDWVTIETGQDGTGVIANIEPRKNYIIRKSINLSKQSHIIAANVDRAFLIVTLRMPETPLEFVDRFLIVAEAYSIPVCLVFNKVDIYTAEELDILANLEKIYQTIGYQTIRTSTHGTGIEELKQLLHGSTSVIAGLSGAGKSSLINAVDPTLHVRVGDISEYHRSGKHTTTYAEMIELKGGGDIIDTPGIKGFGLIHIEKEELYHFFPEIFRISSQCLFHNCRHINEPGCAVIKAVQSGQISASRYNNYLNIMSDSHNKYR